MSNYNQEFKFKKHEKIGYVDAQEDISFLEECFVDTGELDILADTMKPECIVLGRTGSGKYCSRKNRFWQDRTSGNACKKERQKQKHSDCTRSTWLNISLKQSNAEIFHGNRH